MSPELGATGRSPAPLSLTRNPLSIAGMVLTTLGAVFFLLGILLDLFGIHTNPYIGIVFFVLLPGLFLLGLALVPIGTMMERRRRQRQPELRARQWPRIDFNDSRHRRVFLFVLLATIVNILIISLAAFRGVEYMDSVSFCGQVCHEVMEPQFVAYQGSPHARVKCVECHIGPGVPWFVRSKFSGIRQLFGVMFDHHARPIPSPVENLRPARDTCEQCHWPEKFHGEKVRVFREYAGDKENTETVTTLRIHVGGGNEKLGVATGIHWHMNLANEIDYIATDEKRQTIPYVRLKDRSGNIREYILEGARPEAFAGAGRRRMDCLDCHNRPSHRFAASPAAAVNEAIATGGIDRRLPFIKREVESALKGEYRSQPEATAAIGEKLRNFYRTQPPAFENGPEQLERAIAVSQDIFRRSIFPSMRVTWGTYPNHIGHTDSPGCFRCHDDKHKSTDGKVIRQDCDLCHEML
jgi:hypothetical protein